MILSQYKVQFLNGPLADVQRWSVHPAFLCGGSIIDAADWKGLQAPPFGCSYVINLEQEHSDQGKGIADLLEIPRPDDGSPRPAEWFQNAWRFAREKVASGQRGYLHCQAGGSRTPAMLYYFLRKLGYSQADALAFIRQDRPAFGVHSYHVAYIASAEAALRPFSGVPQ